MQDDFGSNCLIGTMGRNQGKSATMNIAWSKIQNKKKRMIHRVTNSQNCRPFEIKWFNQ